MHPYRLIPALFVLLLFAACSPPATPTVPGETPFPTTRPDTATPSPTAAVIETPVVLPADTPPPAPDTPEPAQPVFPLARPILPPGRDVIDPTYRYGTTQGGEREPHNGVEFLNSQGTPVSAAADGIVLFAGDDFNGSPFSPRGWFAFYGQFVVLQHDFPQYDVPVYSLYAHLSEILVETGDPVQNGQLLGLVGFTGAATGSHLHFEVRFGGTTSTDSRNPEAWLAPHPGNGSLVGGIRDAQNLPVPTFSLQLTALDGSGYTQYFSTYEEPAFAMKAPYNESFAFGDLPAGLYELSFVAYKLEKVALEIRPGELTQLDIVVGGGE